MLEARELEECTFKPRILDYDSVKGGGGRRTTESVDRFTELYNKAKPMREKKDKTAHDFEYEKGADECTFIPNISKSMKTLNTGQTYYETLSAMEGSNGIYGTDQNMNYNNSIHSNGSILIITE